ncbi:MAG: shufflon system plasmid conjugative transfer pilus tip adhesin PilV [Sodalis sp. (in: enterobacteria)]
MVRLKKGLWQITDVSIAVLVVIVMVAIVIGPLAYSLQDSVRMNIAASQARRVEAAVNKYITDNYAAIGAASSPSQGYTLTVPMLVTAGYLPAGFSARNNYSSTYKTLIYQPEKNKFHSMTFLTGGTRLSLSQARKLAGYIGASGGYIQGNVAKGALGAWTEKLSAFGGFNPGEGHVVMAGFYANGAMVNDYLYRKAVPGHPELNTMSTALDMGGNDVNAVNNLSASGTVSAREVNTSDTVKAKTTRTSGETYTGGWFRTTGDSGWYSEKWGGGFHMTDSTWIRAFGGKSIYTSGELKGGRVRADGRLSTGEYLQLDGTAQPGAGCGPNGLVGRTSEGALLSCTNGRWTSGGSLEQRECQQVGNWWGRDFREYRCPAGWYASGLQFVGHQNEESAYVITCCH